MAKAFDSRLPKTTTYWTEDQIFFIKNTNFFINDEEIKAMAELLAYAMNDTSTKGIVIDNRAATGVWPKQISELWQDTSNTQVNLEAKKMATLTDNNLATMQTNRLSRVEDIHATSRAFNSDFNEEVRAFLLG